MKRSAPISLMLSSLLLAGCSVVATMHPGLEPPPLCYFDRSNGCASDQLGHEPPPGTFRELSECPSGSTQKYCPMLGDLFSPAPAEPDTATIYLLRPGFSFPFISPYVYAGDERLSDLPPGGYFVLHAPPGMLELATRTEPTRPLQLEVAAGMTCYIQGYFHHDENQPAASRDWFDLSIISGKNALRVLKSMRRVPPGR